MLGNKDESREQLHFSYYTAQADSFLINMSSVWKTFILFKRAFLYNATHKMKGCQAWT